MDSESTPTALKRSPSTPRAGGWPQRPLLVPELDEDGPHAIGAAEDNWLFVSGRRLQQKRVIVRVDSHTAQTLIDMRIRFVRVAPGHYDATIFFMSRVVERRSFRSQDLTVPDDSPPIQWLPSIWLDLSALRRLLNQAFAAKLAGSKMGHGHQTKTTCHISGKRHSFHHSAGRPSINWRRWSMRLRPQHSSDEDEGGSAGWIDVEPMTTRGCLGPPPSDAPPPPPVADYHEYTELLQARVPPPRPPPPVLYDNLKDLGYAVPQRQSERSRSKPATVHPTHGGPVRTAVVQQKRHCTLVPLPTSKQHPLLCLTFPLPPPLPPPVDPKPRPKLLRRISPGRMLTDLPVVSTCQAVPFRPSRPQATRDLHRPIPGPPSSALVGADSWQRPKEDQSVGVCPPPPSPGRALFPGPAKPVRAKRKVVASVAGNTSLSPRPFSPKPDGSGAAVAPQEAISSPSLVGKVSAATFPNASVRPLRDSNAVRPRLPSRPSLAKLCMTSCMGKLDGDGSSTRSPPTSAATQSAAMSSLPARPTLTKLCLVRSTETVVDPTSTLAPSSSRSASSFSVTPPKLSARPSTEKLGMQNLTNLGGCGPSAPRSPCLTSCASPQSTPLLYHHSSKIQLINSGHELAIGSALACHWPTPTTDGVEKLNVRLAVSNDDRKVKLQHHPALTSTTTLLDSRDANASPALMTLPRCNTHPHNANARPATPETLCTDTASASEEESYPPMAAIDVHLRKTHTNENGGIKKHRDSLCLSPLHSKTEASPEAAGHTCKSQPRPYPAPRPRIAPQPTKRIKPVPRLRRDTSCA